MTNQTWPLDMDVLAQTAGSRAIRLLPQLIPVYLEDSELLIGWMAEALRVDSATKLQQAAHRLKGNSASMGVLTISKLATELEALGKTGDLVTAVQAFAALSQEYERVKSALLDLVSQVE